MCLWILRSFVFLEVAIQKGGEPLFLGAATRPGAAEEAEVEAELAEGIGEGEGEAEEEPEGAEEPTFPPPRASSSSALRKSKVSESLCSMDISSFCEDSLAMSSLMPWFTKKFWKARRIADMSQHFSGWDRMPSRIVR